MASAVEYYAGILVLSIKKLAEDWYYITVQPLASFIHAGSGPERWKTKIDFGCPLLKWSGQTLPVGVASGWPLKMA